MSVVELQELDEVKGLLAKGQQVGVLSYAEIGKAMSELDLDESDVEELHGFLEKAEIELVVRRRWQTVEIRRNDALAWVFEQTQQEKM